MLRVLIVDDAREIRQLLRLTLELDGRFEVVGEAADGEEGIALAGELRPDRVVLDVEMPVLGGIAALPGLRAAAPDARILVFSSASEELEDAALAAGAAAYRLKGTDLAELADLLADLVAPAPRGASEALSRDSVLGKPPGV